MASRAHIVEPCRPDMRVRAEPERKLRQLLGEDRLEAMPQRAAPFAVQCEAGNVYLIEAGWNEDYLDELCLFPGGGFKDQVDASSGAFGRLVKPRASTAIFGTYGSARG